MKHIHITAIGLLSALFYLFVACDEQAPDLYDAPNGIYFNNRTSNNTLLDSTVMTFVYQPDSVDYVDMPVVVQSVGRQADFDREVLIKVSSPDAELGVDYELITPPVMPANTSRFVYYVRVKKVPALETAAKTIYLELQSNDYFQIFLQQESTGDSQNPYTDMLHYRIEYSNFFAIAPEGWLEEYVGVFSERKLRLLWSRYPYIPRENFNSKGLIPYNQWVYIQKDINEYMAEQFWLHLDGMADEEALDENGNLLDFTPVL